MSIYSDVCHQGLLCELHKELRRNIILYTLDGFAYYGRLSQVIDDRVAVLLPATDQTDVIVRHPDQTWGSQGNAAIRETETYVDLCTVVAKTAPQNGIPAGFGY